MVSCFNLNTDFTGAVLIGFPIYHSLSATPPVAQIPVKWQPRAEQTRRLCGKAGRDSTALKKERTKRRVEWGTKKFSAEREILLVFIGGPANKSTVEILIGALYREKKEEDKLSDKRGFPL